MINLTFSEKEVKNTNTYELTCTAVGGSPFVLDKDDVFLNIASPADMVLISATPDGESLYRGATITLIFREEHTKLFTIDNIEKQVAELNSIDLVAQQGVTLFSKL